MNLIARVDLQCDVSLYAHSPGQIAGIIQNCFTQEIRKLHPVEPVNVMVIEAAYLDFTIAGGIGLDLKLSKLTCHLSFFQII